MPGWEVVATARELGSTPLSRTVRGQALVLFRDLDGAPAALLDRCPHRGAPLSAGRVRTGGLECGYHGWTFGGDGRCRRIPGLASPLGAVPRAAQVPAYRTLEQDGLIWLWSGAGDGTDDGPSGPPSVLPPRPACLGEPGYASLTARYRFEAALADVAENALDVPHTAFLHGRLFRGGPLREPIEIKVLVRREPDRVEARYGGEPRPAGWLARLLAPRGGELEHVDRFIAPGTTEVEYRLGERSHLIATGYLTPESEQTTWLHAVVVWRLPWPGWLVRMVAGPLARRILAQDQAMLSRIAETDRRAAGPDRRPPPAPISTELDVLGAHIRELLRQEPGGAPARTGERRLRIRV